MASKQADPSKACKELAALLRCAEEDGISAAKLSKFFGIPALKLTRWKLGWASAPEEFRIYCKTLLYLRNELKLNIYDLLEESIKYDHTKII